MHPINVKKMKNIKKYIKKKLFEWFKDEILKHVGGNASEYLGPIIVPRNSSPIKLCREARFEETKWLMGVSDEGRSREHDRLEKMRELFISDLKNELMKEASKCVVIEKSDFFDGSEIYRASITLYQENR